jgi:hypothetical protein
VSAMTHIQGPAVFLVNGLAGAGKSETFKFFTSPAFRSNRPEFRLVKFAGTLKRMIRVLLEDAGIDDTRIDEMLDGSQEQKLEAIPELRGTNCRHLMKMLGSEWRDTIYPELWADLSDLKAATVLQDGCRVMYDDYRFDHERHHIIGRYSRERVALIQIQGRDHAKRKDADTHQSERPMDEALFDVVIRNHGTIPDLRRMLAQAERDIYALGVGNGPRIYTPEMACAAA